MRSVVAEKIEKQCVHAAGLQDPPWKSSTPIRAAEYFRPVHKLIGVKSVQKIETGLECDQLLLRKLKITLTGAHCATLLCEHSISQFSRQPLSRR